MAALTESEEQWQANVVELAGLLGWNTMHVRRSKVRGDRWATATSHDGWPDLVLWHPIAGQLIVAELKSNKGRLTQAQIDTLRSIQACGTLAYIWRPHDLPAVRDILQRSRRQHEELTVDELYPEGR